MKGKRVDIKKGEEVGKPSDADAVAEDHSSARSAPMSSASSFDVGGLLVDQGQGGGHDEGLAVLDATESYRAWPRLYWISMPATGSDFLRAEDGSCSLGSWL